jgi:NAD(P)-dependent dehydrogenase (short-subunit alcohol dehydrogenase family)
MAGAGVADVLRWAAGCALGIVADVTDAEAVQRAVDRTIAELGGLHILVNNAGTNPRAAGFEIASKRFWDIPVAAWDRVLAVNGTGPFYLARAAGGHLRQQGWGRIVGVTTSVDTMFGRGRVPYGPSKAAHEALIASMAEDLEGSGVTANVLVPGGPTNTNFFSDKTPAQRAALIQPEVMQAPLVWLASDDSKDWSGRRLIASRWDPSLPIGERLAAAGAPAAWPQLGKQAVRPRREGAGTGVTEAISDAGVAPSRALGDGAGLLWTPIVYPGRQHFEPRPWPTISAPDGLRLYLHIPFCRYHCTFCIYAVRGGARRPEMERYVAALARELEAVEPGTSLSKLIVGGGTPTALPPDLLDAVLAPIIARTQRPADCLSKVEASPDSLSDEHIAVLHKHGIRWMSIGVESTDEAVLRTVRRRHSTAQSLDALRRVAQSGLLLNADLIYGLPGQSLESFRRDLEAVSESGVDSVCMYALRLRRPGWQAAREAERLDHTRCAARVRGAHGPRARLHPDAILHLEASRRGDHPDTAEGGGGPQRPTRLALGGRRSQLRRTVYRNHDGSASTWTAWSRAGARRASSARQAGPAHAVRGGQPETASRWTARLYRAASARRSTHGS